MKKNLTPEEYERIIKELEQQRQFWFEKFNALYEKHWYAERSLEWNLYSSRMVLVDQKLEIVELRDGSTFQTPSYLGYMPLTRLYGRWISGHSNAQKEEIAKDIEKEILSLRKQGGTWEGFNKYSPVGRPAGYSRELSDGCPMFAQMETMFTKETPCT